MRVRVCVPSVRVCVCMAVCVGVYVCAAWMLRAFVHQCVCASVSECAGV